VISNSDVPDRHGCLFRTVQASASSWFLALDARQIGGPVLCFDHHDREVERGIERQRRPNPDFAEALLAWLERSIAFYADRILPVTTSIGRRWGRLSARLGHDSVDLLIAATALEHGLTVATRNVRNFAPTGVAIENPFDTAV